MILTPSGRGLGYRRDSHDHRDHFYAASPDVLDSKLPASIDLRRHMPPVYDQGRLGSCTANAIAAALEYEAMRQGEKLSVPSRLMIYYDERVMESTVDLDAGAEIRDGIKSVVTTGVCPEDQWPYDITKFAQKPPQDCYDAANKFKALKYSRVIQTAQQLRGCLASARPFVFGFSVYSAMESDEVARTGRLTLPAPDEAPLGGHAVLAVGYDDDGRNFLIRNSWGAYWGLKGYFLMPYEYMLRADLVSDIWTIKTVV